MMEAILEKFSKNIFSNCVIYCNVQEKHNALTKDTTYIFFSECGRGNGGGSKSYFPSTIPHFEFLYFPFSIFIGIQVTIRGRIFSKLILLSDGYIFLAALVDTVLKYSLGVFPNLQLKQLYGTNPQIRE